MIASVPTKKSLDASTAMVGAFSFSLHSFAERFISRVRFERGFLGRTSLPKIHVSQRHSCSAEPQPALKMTRSVCWQGPFSWPHTLLTSNPTNAHLAGQCVALKTVYAAHIPHFAGRQTRVNLLRRRLYGRCPQVQLRCAKLLRVLVWLEASRTRLKTRVGDLLDPPTTPKAESKAS